MSSEAYRFDVGGFRCVAVSDGTFAYPHPSKNVFINFFVNAPEDRLKRALREHGIVHEQWEEYVSPYTCLVISEGKEHVLVDTGAVIDALKTGRLGYLGLDVYEEEAGLFHQDLSSSVIQDDVFARLTTFPNVIITGHQGYFTREALAGIAETTVSNITSCERGEDCANIVRIEDSGQ